MVTTTNPQAPVLAYLDAFERRDFDRVSELLDPDLTFQGPGAPIQGAPEYVAALRRLSPILLRNDVKRVFVDGADVCVIYDFVTDTAAGALPTVEWHRVEDGRIRSIWLLFDRQSFGPVVEELARRAGRASN